MKHLPKHLRPRWRYLAVGLETWPEAELNRRAFQRACWRAARELLGDPGSADADLRVLRFRFEETEGAALVRVRHGEVEAARAALACIDAIEGEAIGLEVLGVGGTIKGCQKHLPESSERPVMRTVSFDGETRTAFERGSRIDVREKTGFVGVDERDLDT